MKLSIVATLFNSASHIDEFYRRASVVARKLVGDDYEIIFVNDGSPDHSLDIAVDLTEADIHVIVVNLSRNFGHHKAMMTGLAHASGQQVFLIDCDLEEEPECLTSFDAQMKRETSDVVYGVQEKRKGNWFERWSGQCFYRLFNFLSGEELPENVLIARLMTRNYVDALLLHTESEFFIGGLFHLTGFDQSPQTVIKHNASETTYTLRRKMSLLINSVTSFSNAPLKGIFYLGLLISLLAVVYIFYLVIQWLLIPSPLSGWTSVIASVWLLGGMIISFIGIIGIYLSRIFSETKQRPYTIVKGIFKKDDYNTKR